MNRKHLFIIFLLTVVHLFSEAKAEEKPPYHDASHITQLDEIKAKAQGQVDNNLNRFGFATLNYYDQLSDSFFTKECRDTVNAINKAFSKTSAEKSGKTARLRAAIDRSTKEQAAAKSSFTGLFKKSLLALGIWLCLVILIIRYRNRKVNRASALLERTKAQASKSAANMANSNRLLEEQEKLSPLLHSNLQQTSELTLQLDQFNDRLPAEDSRIPLLKEILLKNRSLAVFFSRELRLFELAQDQILTQEQEKTTCSVNELCDHMLEIAYRGNCLDSEKSIACVVTRDLEKNLPALKLYPREAAEILLIIFDNAFKSVKERAALLEKGYQPKVAVSTRILPRFLQVRVKDNGVGIPEDLREKILQEFTVNRSTENSAGIGLALAKGLLDERNKGELKIESEAGNGTDIYIKFFL